MAIKQMMVCRRADSHLQMRSFAISGTGEPRWSAFSLTTRADGSDGAAPCEDGRFRYRGTRMNSADLFFVAFAVGLAGLVATFGGMMFFN